MNKKLRPFLYLVVGLLCIYYISKPKAHASVSIYELPTIEKYSAAVLKLYNQKNLERIDFKWSQFLGLDEFFETHKDQVQGLTCEEFGSRIHTHERSRYNCMDDPGNTVPITMNENVLLFVDEPNRRLLGKIYLHKTLPNPGKLVYLFHDNHVEIPINSDPKPLYIKGSPTLSKEINKLTKFKVAPRQKSVVDLNYEDFDYRVQLPKYDVNSQVSVLDTKYKDTKRAGKYFTEAFLIDIQGMYDADWRFFQHSELFKQPYSFKHMSATSKLIRAWLMFADTYNLKTWISDNNAVGWKFNGLHLPMENKIGFQITMDSLMDLVDKEFNQTIIFNYADYDKEQSGNYFLDINPYIRLRDRNNKENLVDARLIDINTGQYLDIMGVSTFQYEKLYNFKAKPILQSLSEGDIPKVQAKIDRFINHKLGLLYTKELDVFMFEEQYSKLLPIRFENLPAYIPIGYNSLLSDKYFDPMKVNRLGWKYREFLNNWVPLEWCMPPKGNPTKEEDMKCLKNLNVKQLYEANKKATTRHEKFMEYFNGLTEKSYSIDIESADPIIYPDV